VYRTDHTETAVARITLQVALTNHESIRRIQTQPFHIRKYREIAASPGTQLPFAEAAVADGCEHRWSRRDNPVHRVGPGRSLPS